MRNDELNRYRGKPICDMHIHPHVQMPVDETVEVIRSVMEYFHDERIVLESLPSYDVINNFTTLYCKSKLDGVYAGLGLLHRFDGSDTAESYLAQAESLFRMGCDGFKMLEGKPDYRKRLEKPLDDRVFDRFYGFAEEKGLPVVMHVGDPREFWDADRIPRWALERGWLYDDSFVPFRDGHREVEGVLRKFPKLKLVLAHFFFVSDDLSYAEWIMNEWDGVCFDLTPGSEMYFNFSERIDDWRGFFRRYADRILFGSDIYNWRRGDSSMEERYAHAVNLTRSFLEKKGPFLNRWQNVEMKNAFGFCSEVLDKICHDNFIRVFGEERRAADDEYIAFCAAGFGRDRDLSEEQTANLKKIADWFGR